jgi:hypothetical protein
LEREFEAEEDAELPSEAPRKLAPADALDDDPPTSAVDVVDHGDATTHAPPTIPEVRPPTRAEAFQPLSQKRTLATPAAGLAAACVLAAAGGWHFTTAPGACWLTVPKHDAALGREAANVVARRIVVVESSGDASARNTRSSATGAGQFLDGTWLEMIRAYRPDLGARAEAEILDLRYDPEVSREMVARFAEKNAAMLGRRCLPVTPGTLYLSHFAGGGGAVAVLSAPETADAAATMAEADSTGRTTREIIVTANPFLADFTIADLKRWADRKMGGAGWQL